MVTSKLGARMFQDGFMPDQERFRSTQCDGTGPARPWITTACSDVGGTLTLRGERPKGGVTGLPIFAINSSKTHLKNCTGRTQCQGQSCPSPTSPRSNPVS